MKKLRFTEKNKQTPQVIKNAVSKQYSQSLKLTKTTNNLLNSKHLKWNCGLVAQLGGGQEDYFLAPRRCIVHRTTTAARVPHPVASRPVAFVENQHYFSPEYSLQNHFLCVT